MNALKTYYRVKREEEEKASRERWENMTEEEKQAARDKAKEMFGIMAVVNSMTRGEYK